MVNFQFTRKVCWQVSSKNSSLSVYGSTYEVQQFLGLLQLITNGTKFNADIVSPVYKNENTFFSLEQYFKTIPPIGVVDGEVYSTRPERWGISPQKYITVSFYIPCQANPYSHLIRTEYVSEFQIAGKMLLEDWGDIPPFPLPYKVITRQISSYASAESVKGMAWASIRQDIDTLSTVSRFNALMYPLVSLKDQRRELHF